MICRGKYCFDDKELLKQLDLAQCGMSGVKVAACIVTTNKKNQSKLFYGSNIEIARSKVYHAEETVLIKAITEGYINIKAVILTSNNPKYLVPLCYACRAVYAYVDPYCTVTVVDTDMKMVVQTTIHDSMKFHYESKGFIS